MSSLTEGEFRIEYDNESNPTVMMIRIPLQKISEDRTDNGWIMTLGVLENCKLIIKNLVVTKRRSMEKILIPVH